jgi:hypothetical protein
VSGHRVANIKERQKSTTKPYSPLAPFLRGANNFCHFYNDKLYIINV